MFLNKLYRKALKIFGDIKVFKYPMFIVYCPNNYRMRGEDVRTVLSLIKPGDILLRGYINYLDGYFIPGVFSHAGMYIGNDTMIHSMAEGVFSDDILNFCRCDKLAILRFNTISDENIEIACSNAKDLIGKKYDFEAEEDDDEYYCTEAVVEFYKHMKDTLRVYPINTKIAGITKKIISPDQFLRSPALDLIYNSLTKFQ